MMTKLKGPKPIIKFNGGYGAILCNKCHIIIKSGLTQKEFSGKTDLVWCDKCAPVELHKHLDGIKK